MSTKKLKDSSKVQYLTYRGLCLHLSLLYVNCFQLKNSFLANIQMAKIENDDLNKVFYDTACRQHLKKSRKTFEYSRSQRANVLHDIASCCNKFCKTGKHQKIHSNQKKFNSLRKLIFLPDGKIYGKNPRFLGLAIRQWVWRAKLVRGLLGSFRSALFDHKHLQRNCTTYRQANSSRENNGTEYLQWSRQLGQIK